MKFDLFERVDPTPMPTHSAYLEARLVLTPESFTPCWPLNAEFFYTSRHTYSEIDLAICSNHDVRIATGRTVGFRARTHEEGANAPSLFARQANQVRLDRNHDILSDISPWVSAHREMAR